MTVSSETNKESHNGDGSTVAFVLTAPVRDVTHVEVTTRVEATLVETTMVLNGAGATGYTAALATDFSSITVTFNTAPASGVRITINRVVPYTQEDDYALFDGFPASVIEGSVDLSAMADQRLNEILSRCIRLPKSTPEVDPELEDFDDNALSYVRLNADGDELEFVSLDLTEAVEGAINSLAGTIYESITDMTLADSPKSLVIGDEGVLLRVDTTGNTPTAITGVTRGAVTSVSVASHTFAVGEFIYIDGITGTTQLNGRTYKISVQTATLLTITDTNDVNINSTNYTAWSSDGTITESLTVNLPDLALIAEDYKVAIMKSSGDSNSLIVNGVNSQNINGSTHNVQNLRWQTVVYIGDLDNLEWFAIGSGTGLASIHRETFDGNTATITLANDPSTENNTQIYVDGVYQSKNTYSVSDQVVTFDTTPPAGVGNVEVMIISTESIGVPGNGTVGVDQIQDGVLDQSFIVACSDETSDLVAGTGKSAIRMPYAFTLKSVRAMVNTAPTGATIIVDINASGATILDTKLTIDATEKTSTTAATAFAFTGSALTLSLDDDELIEFDLDQIGSSVAGAGLKVTLIGDKT